MRRIGLVVGLFLCFCWKSIFCSVYCSGCDTVQSTQRLAGVRLIFKDQDIQCANNELKRGHYSNMKMTLYTPSKKKFLDVSGMDESLFDDLSTESEACTTSNQSQLVV